MPKSPLKPTQEYSHWLIKAEPDSRIEKGVDVKFSIDDLQQSNVSSWEGVRNHQAKNFLKSQMKRDHLCLFYASNTKLPGITGIAKVVKEGYPDYNAWDQKHPYYDPKSNKDNPTWYMVDVEFVSRLPHLVPLSLLQYLSQLSSPPPSLPYLTSSHLTEISNSALISRGRLSVQPASQGFFEACRMLGEKGGFEELMEEIKEGKKNKGKGKGKVEKGKVKKEEEISEDEGKNEGRKSTRGKKEKDVKDESGEEEEVEKSKPKSKSKVESSSTTRKSAPKRGRKVVKSEEEEDDGESEEEKMPTRGSSSRPQSKRPKK